MRRYSIKLSDNFTGQVFTSPWSTNLLGEDLRVEFEAYFEKVLKEKQAVKGGSVKVIKSDILKQFMTQEKMINIVKDTHSGGLKSVFLLKKGDEIIVDEQAYEDLKRFEDKKKKSSDGTESDSLGFMKIKVVKEDGEEEGELEVSGEAFEGFNLVSGAKNPAAETFKCENCDKEFASEKSLRGHNIKCRKEDGTTNKDK